MIAPGWGKAPPAWALGLVGGPCWASLETDVQFQFGLNELVPHQPKKHASDDLLIVPRAASPCVRNGTDGSRRLGFYHLRWADPS